MEESSEQHQFRTRVDEIVQQWGFAITAGRLRPGTRMSTDVVARSSSVGRGVIREAMRVLETLGLVTIRQRSGITVTSSEHWNVYDEHVLAWRLDGPQRAETLRELAHLRDAVEPHAARLAAERATAEECGVLAGAVSGLTIADRSGNPVNWLTQAQVFHTTVLRATRNQFYAGIAPLIRAALQAEPKPAPAPRSEALRSYAETAGAIQRGDLTAAASNMARVVRPAPADPTPTEDSFSG